MKSRSSKARKKRWFKARVRSHHRAKRKENFERDFRAHFVRKGLLTDDGT